MATADMVAVGALWLSTGLLWTAKVTARKRSGLAAAVAVAVAVAVVVAQLWMEGGMEWVGLG